MIVPSRSSSAAWGRGWCGRSGTRGYHGRGERGDVAVGNGAEVEQQASVTHASHDRRLTGPQRTGPSLGVAPEREGDARQRRGGKGARADRRRVILDRALHATGAKRAGTALRTRTDLAHRR